MSDSLQDTQTINSLSVFNSQCLLLYLVIRCMRSIALWVEELEALYTKSEIVRQSNLLYQKLNHQNLSLLQALKVIEKKGNNLDKIKQKIQNEIQVVIYKINLVIFQQVHSSLHHENIVELIAHFEDNDNYYLLMELCEGGELYNLVKQKGR